MSNFPVEVPDPLKTNDVWELLFVEECILHAVHVPENFDREQALNRRTRWRNYLLAGITEANHFKVKSNAP